MKIRDKKKKKLKTIGYIPYPLNYKLQIIPNSYGDQEGIDFP